MNTLETIAKRVSVRAYQPKQIPEDALQVILKAGNSAPVASARYDAMHITVVQSEAALKQIMEATSDFVSRLFGHRKEMDFGAKTLIIVSGAPGMMPGIEYANAGCILENMILAAASLGIDSIIWGGAAAVVSQSEEMKKTLGIPHDFQPLLCASLGYAEETQPAKEYHIPTIRI